MDQVDANASSEGSGDADGIGNQGASRGAESGVVGVTMSTAQFTAESYNMNHKERGIAVIFNNKTFDPSTGKLERTGTDVDAENMYMILSEMGFDTRLKHDLSARAMEDALIDIARENHGDADCFACVVLSHGEEGCVYGTDGTVEIDKLVGPFKGNRCQTLAGKPKIFFIQACRGDKLDEGVDVCDARGGGASDAMETDVDIRKIPSEADFFMAYSVVPGYLAWRNPTRGSWFVQALTEVLRENWKRMDLLSMMTRVSGKVAYDFESNTKTKDRSHKKQIPCVTTMLTRDLYFTPK